MELIVEVFKLLKVLNNDQILCFDFLEAELCFH